MTPWWNMPVSSIQQPGAAVCMECEVCRHPDYRFARQYMIEIFQEIYHTLLQGKELVVVTIISDSGSTPRTSGSRMIVYRDGRISGTIGGGAVEGDVIQSALCLFKTRGAIIATYDLSQTGDTAQTDLICGGQVQILIEHVSVSDKSIKVYGEAYQEIKISQPFFWVGKITRNGDHWQVERAVQNARNKFFGSFQLKHDLQKMLETDNFSPQKTSFFEIGGQSFLIEPILPPETVYLIGAGHVTKEIASLSKQVGFRTLVFDDRAAFANLNRFPDADEIHVCPEFSGIFEEHEINDASYIIIVTRGHYFDKEVLAQALQTKAGYIGMIGSLRKRDSIYKILIDEGFDQSALDRVFCPIGLPIEAETPAEIGVSVVAQLIHHRAKRKKHD